MASPGGAPAPAPRQQVVKVRRELMAACMTCPLCHKLLREATTISECLHTFCRKCIFEKLADEEVDCCPICNIDLGCVPVEKLRPDHSLQDVRAKIFPYKRRKVEAPEVLSSISFPVKRKERSLSSLVVNTPRVGSQTGLTGRRTKTSRRAAALRGLSPVIVAAIRKQNDNITGRDENSSSPETLTKMTYSRRQSSSNGESSNYAPYRNTDNNEESFLDKFELWKPLNCLVEAANRTKALKSSPQSTAIKAEPINGPNCVVNNHKSKLVEHSHDENGSISSVPPKVKSRRLRGVNRKIDLGISAQALVDAAAARHDRKISPIWFSLVASTDQEGDVPLPQVSACYLRIKDGELPVSFIQKYLVKKLGLANEAEVEIMCHGQLVSPTMALHNLVDMWLRAGSSQRVQASVGTSAKDFVMVLCYGRKVVIPQTLQLSTL